VRLGPAEVVFTGRAEGDLGHAGAWVETPEPEVEARRQAVLARRWTWLRQVHGARVVVVKEPGGCSREQADAAVSKASGAALAIFTADCAPVALASENGVIGAAHAGWRSIHSGVITHTVDAMRALGAEGPIQAALGPCIHAECYEFGADDLALFGREAHGVTKEGEPALDVPAAVKSALRAVGVELVYEDDRCTACEADALFSHRARQELQRQAMVVWVP
jgi:polyphenol oxidase